MKLLLLLAIFLKTDPPVIYDISFQSIDGQTVSMAAFKGKRIIVASLDAQKPSAEKIAFLDSLGQKMPDVQIIIVPAIVSGKVSQDAQIKEFKNTLKSNLIIAASSPVSKNADKEQQTLFQWLTKVENNTHFEMDGDAEQYFVVSAEGTLYAIAEAGTPQRVLLEYLKIQFDESQHLIYNPETKLYEPRKK